MKRIIKDYLYFSKQERFAVLILLSVMTLFIIAPYWYVPKIDPPVIDQSLTDWLSARADSSAPATMVSTAHPGKPPALFAFDPNTASMEDWIRLGITAKTAGTILRYRSKGGKFRKADDLKKIWGMPVADAERLIPYVRLAGVESFGKNIMHPKAGEEAHAKKAQTLIDINTAGLAEWASLPGIGDVLANRIIRYRDKLGGFGSVQQVGKTYGISDSLFGVVQAYLRYDAGTLPKINLNTAPVYALKQAGFDPLLAQQLVRYRERNGPYKSLDDLRRLVDMSDSAWQQLVMRCKTE